MAHPAPKLTALEARLIRLAALARRHGGAKRVEVAGVGLRILLHLHAALLEGDELAVGIPVPLEGALPCGAPDEGRRRLRRRASGRVGRGGRGVWRLGRTRRGHRARGVVDALQLAVHHGRAGLQQKVHAGRRGAAERLAGVEGVGIGSDVVRLAALPAVARAAERRAEADPRDRLPVPERLRHLQAERLVAAALEASGAERLGAGKHLAFFPDVPGRGLDVGRRRGRDRRVKVAAGRRARRRGRRGGGCDRDDAARLLGATRTEHRVHPLCPSESRPHEDAPRLAGVEDKLRASGGDPGERDGAGGGVGRAGPKRFDALRQGTTPVGRQARKGVGVRHGMCFAQESETSKTWIVYALTLVGVAIDHPLRNVAYIGQAVRVGDQLDILKRRVSEHLERSRNDPRTMGIRSAIQRFGIDAFEATVLSSGTCEPTKAHELANTEEIRQIDVHGGLLKDMEPDAPMPQTFNLKEGGQHTASAWWGGVLARGARRWREYIAHREEYSKITKDPIPQSFVCSDGYPLGRTEQSVLKVGQMIEGHPDSKKRIEAIQNQGIRVRDRSDEWKKYVIERKQFNTQSEFPPKRNFVSASGYPLGQTEDSIRNAAHFIGKNLDVDIRAERIRQLDALGFEWNPPKGPRDWTRELPRNISKKREKYQVAVRRNGKSVYIGTFKSVPEAEIALSEYRKANTK